MKRVLPFAVILALIAGVFVVYPMARDPYYDTYGPWVPTVPDKNQVIVLQENDTTYYIPDMGPMVFSKVWVNGRTIFVYDLVEGVDYNLYSRDGNTVIRLTGPLNLEPGEYVLVFEFVSGYGMVDYYVGETM